MCWGSGWGPGSQHFFLTPGRSQSAGLGVMVVYSGGWRAPSSDRGQSLWWCGTRGHSHFWLQPPGSSLGLATREETGRWPTEWKITQGPVSRQPPLGCRVCVAPGATPPPVAVSPAARERACVLSSQSQSFPLHSGSSRDLCLLSVLVMAGAVPPPQQVGLACRLLSCSELFSATAASVGLGDSAIDSVS